MLSAFGLRLAPLALMAVLVACGGPREERYPRPAAAAPAVVLDHAWLAVREGPAERAMLEEGGFRFASSLGVGRILFENGFVELIAPSDPRAAAGPFGLAFRSAGAAAAPLSAVPSGSRTVALSYVQQPVDEAANRALVTAGGVAAEPFLHPNGARRITGIRVSAPTRAALPAAASFVNLSGAAELRVGTEWLMELELDHGAQNQELDLRPRMALVIRF